MRLCPSPICHHSSPTICHYPCWTCHPRRPKRIANHRSRSSGVLAIVLGRGSLRVRGTEACCGGRTGRTGVAAEAGRLEVGNHGFGAVLWPLPLEHGDATPGNLVLDEELWRCSCTKHWGQKAMQARYQAARSQTIYAYICVCKYVCKHVCMYVCMHVYTLHMLFDWAVELLLGK